MSYYNNYLDYPPIDKYTSWYTWKYNYPVYNTITYNTITYINMGDPVLKNWNYTVKDTDYAFSLDLPGADPLTVKATPGPGDGLTLEGTRNGTRTYKDFVVQHDGDMSKAKGVYQNGVLTVTVPRSLRPNIPVEIK